MFYGNLSDFEIGGSYYNRIWHDFWHLSSSARVIFCRRFSTGSARTNMAVMFDLKARPEILNYKSHNAHGQVTSQLAVSQSLAGKQTCHWLGRRDKQNE